MENKERKKERESNKEVMGQWLIWVVFGGCELWTHMMEMGMALTGDFNFSCPISRPSLSQFVSTKPLHLFFPLCFFHTSIIGGNS